jgi:hypothetical protein
MESLPIKDLAAIIGTAAAGLYFYYKVISGGMAVNMSVSLASERRSDGEDNDFISVIAVLKKGDHGSVSIYDLQAKIVSLGCEPIYKKFSGISRQDWDDNHNINWGAIRRGSGHTNNPYIRITPGEQLQFALLNRNTRDWHRTLYLIHR